MARRVTNIFFVMGFLMLMSGCCEAQNGKGGVASVDFAANRINVEHSYDFIQYDSNTIWIGPDSSLIRKFADKWYDVTTNKKGRINILQIGASHVQGGMMSHRIRRNLLIPYADLVSDRGMVFPYSAANKCNNPFDYKVTRSRALSLSRIAGRQNNARMGLCGIAVTAADSAASIGISINETQIDFATTRVILLGYSSGGVVPRMRLMSDKSKSSADTALFEPTEVDTLNGRYSFAFPAATDRFEIVLPCSDGQSFTLTGVYLANDAPGISFHSIGVNGASTYDYINKCPDFVRDLRIMPPDLVIFGVGINDAAGTSFDTVVFKRRYLALVDSIRRVNPDCAFIFVTNNDSYRKVKKSFQNNPNGALAHDVFFRLALATGGAVWDQFRIMGGLGSMDKFYANQLAQKDRIHFTKKGYELIGDMFSLAFYDMLRQMAPRGVGNTGTAPASQDNKPTNSTPNQDGRPSYIYY